MDQVLLQQETAVPDVAGLPDGLEAAEAARQRGDQAGALHLLNELRGRYPDHPAPYLRAAGMLSQSGRFEEAEALLAEGADRFPNDTGFTIERGWLASRRGQLDEALEVWQQVRSTLPDHHVGYTGAAQALRDASRIEEAEALLREAMQGLPNEPAPRIEYAWLAHRARDWPEAARRWEEVRKCHSGQVTGFTAGAIALRELRRFDDAEALLAEALSRFPGDRGVLNERAWLAVARRDWPEAVSRWALVRERFPDIIESYLRGAQALSSMWRHEEAEGLLSEAMERFPQDNGVAAEHAWLAYHRHLPEAAGQRFSELRRRFPGLLAGYLGGARVFRDQFRLAEAEAMLEEAHRRFPDEPSLLSEHARIPLFHPLRRERDPEEAMRRVERLLAKFPLFEEAYLLGVRTLRELGRPSEADELAEIGIGLLPQSAALAIEHANNARERGDWAEAIWRYGAARQRFPDDPGGPTGLAASLSLSGRHADGEQALREAMERFPANSAVFAEFARIAVRQEEWAEALARWREAQKRFPDEQEFAHRIFETELRLAESRPEQPADAENDTLAGTAERAAEADRRAATRDLLMQFESLGGRGLGCEFGMFQREFGAEPLGLLRWADMPYDGIVFALESRFDGVGAPEHTELFVERQTSRPEYCTRDKRGFMFMRSFVYEDEMPFERMWKQALRRLIFLKHKLIADLEAGDKIFIYRLTDRNLEPGELERLHRAVRSYGDNMLLYVRYEDAAHPNGTVEFAAPGLIIGYIDRFKMAPDGQLSASPPSASWLEICRNAYALFEGADQGSEAAPGAALSQSSMTGERRQPAATTFSAVRLQRPELRLDDDGTRVRRGLQALEDLYNPRPAPFIAGNKDEFCGMVARTVGDVPLIYLEFGVWRGASIARMAQQFRHPDARFYGFDSFEGLPERWDPNNNVGQFSTSGALANIPDSRVSFVKGWFQDTVPDFLASHSFAGPVLVHYDADLYSSTLFLMTTLCHHFREYYFIYDEFFPDEVNALREFATAYPIEIGFEAAILNQEHQRPVQLFGKLRRVPFQLGT
jgi:tetratricopeptide (TPR) repeat protein